MRHIYRFFDKLEDKIRGRLSRHPIFYAFLGGIGAIIFWRGIWHTTDFVMETLFSSQLRDGTIDLGILPWWDGPLSILIGGILLLMTGLFVSNFIGNEIIISGLKGEKKLTEKTEGEVRIETGAISEIKKEVKEMSHHLDDIEKDFKKGE